MAGRTEFDQSGFSQSGFSQFGPDGTADPPPDRWYPDPLAGLTPGEIPVFEQDRMGDPNRGVLAPAVETPDDEAVREAMEAVLAAEQEQPPQPPRPRQRSSTASGREAAQPGRLPVNQRRNAPARSGRQLSWPYGAAARRARRATGTGTRTQPLRKQPALLIVVMLVLIVVFFNVLSSLFSWLNTAFH